VNAPSAPTESISTRAYRGRIDWFQWFSRIVAVILIALVAGPLAVMLWRIFAPNGTLDVSAFAEVVEQPWLWDMLRDTLVTVAISVVAAMILGSFFAWLTERTDAQMGWLSRLLPVLPLFMPPLAGVIGWALLASPGPGAMNVWIKQLFAVLGWGDTGGGPFDIYTWPGLVMLYTFALTPSVYLVVSAALRNVESSLEEAARTSGVGPLRTLLTVTLPAIRPALLSAALLAIASGFGLFSVPFIVGTEARIDNLIVRVVQLVTGTYPSRIDLGSVLGLLVVFFIGGTWLLQRRVSRLARHARLEGKTSSASIVRLGGFRWVARVLLIAYIALTSVLPLYALISVAFQSFWSGAITAQNFTWKNFATVLSPTKPTFQALLNSVVLGALTAVIAMLVATIIAYYGERRPLSVVARITDGVIKLPAALSHIVLAIAVIFAFSGTPFELHGTLLLLFIGYFVLYLPQASVNAGSALTQLGPALTEASLTSGAGEVRTFFRIILPLMGPGLVAGWVMVFVLAAGDLTASVMLASGSSPVISFVMLDLSASGTRGQVAALGTLITLVNVVIGGAVLLVGQQLGRRVGVRRRPRVAQ